MKFHNGLFDRLFGKKVTIEVPLADGSTRSVVATEAWLRRMQQEGKAEFLDPASDSMPFHVIGPYGSETRQLRRGVDIPEQQYLKLRDPGTGAIYGLTVYEKGVPSTTAIPKAVWDQAKKQFDAIDQEAERSSERLRETLRKL